MFINSKRPRAALLLATLALPTTAVLAAPQSEPAVASAAAPADPIVVDGERLPVDPASMTKGPEVRGIIAARSGDRLRIQTADGASTVVAIGETTRIKGSSGLFGSSGAKPGPSALLNGLPVTVKTMQGGGELFASQITFRNTDLKTASMIRTGTAQQFADQTAATEALRGRVGDIDKYNIKGTTNVYFDTGQAVLSEQAKAELCTTATAAENMDNALMLVVGYTDSTGGEEVNQPLSEKRAARVINYLQQVCRWKPYRMLTPTGMAEADPLASNDTAEGKAQNRRVAVNILVSKGLDGIEAASR